jgi:hypothetical protein
MPFSATRRGKFSGVSPFSMAAFVSLKEAAPDDLLDDELGERVWGTRIGRDRYEIGRCSR